MKKKKTISDILKHNDHLQNLQFQKKVPQSIQATIPATENHDGRKWENRGEALTSQQIVERTLKRKAETMRGLSSKKPPVVLSALQTFLWSLTEWVRTSRRYELSWLHGMQNSIWKFVKICFHYSISRCLHTIEICTCGTFWLTLNFESTVFFNGILPAIQCVVWKYIYVS